MIKAKLLPLTRLGIYLLLLCASNLNAAPALNVVIPPLEPDATPQYRYFYTLLELALKKTEKAEGPVKISYASATFTTERYLAELSNNNTIDVLWTMGNKKREQNLLPVRISLLRDLNSYRVLLIRKEDREKFAKIQTLDELRALKAGLGSQWPDTEIMRNNNFTVITSMQYDSLFKMLVAKRFDFFSRGLYEAWNEAEVHKDKNIVIEDHIMLFYNAPFYYFVNKKNKALAERIERGLKMAQADGSFDELFFSIPGFRRGTDEQYNNKRLLFRLESED
ncbi:MAG TPA: diguanylate cyclase [Cellvibrio sp.]|nr:diguanylate cyclase [Cellvibrio sp.]